MQKLGGDEEVREISEKEQQKDAESQKRRQEGDKRVRKMGQKIGISLQKARLQGSRFTEAWSSINIRWAFSSFEPAYAVKTHQIAGHLFSPVAVYTRD